MHHNPWEVIIRRHKRKSYSWKYIEPGENQAYSKVHRSNQSYKEVHRNKTDILESA
jgi:hypothetical protein